MPETASSGPQPRIMARGPGYSLAEVMIVLAVLSVVALVAIPIATPSADVRLDAAAQEVINALRFARIEALRTGTFYGADFSVDPATTIRRGNAVRAPGRSDKVPHRSPCANGLNQSLPNGRRATA